MGLYSPSLLSPCEIATFQMQMFYCFHWWSINNKIFYWRGELELQLIKLLRYFLNKWKGWFLYVKSREKFDNVEFVALGSRRLLNNMQWRGVSNAHRIQLQLPRWFYCIPFCEELKFPKQFIWIRSKQEISDWNSWKNVLPHYTFQGGECSIKFSTVYRYKWK